MKLNLTSRAIVVNQMLLYILWLFIYVWGGSSKALKEILNTLRNYLWFGTEQRARTKVA